MRVLIILGHLQTLARVEVVEVIMASKLSRNVWKNWETTGRVEFMKACVAAIKNEQLSQLYDGSNGYLDELIAQGIRGNLKHDVVANTLKELLHHHHEMYTIIRDVMHKWNIHTQMDKGENNESNYSNFGLLFEEWHAKCEEYINEFDEKMDAKCAEIEMQKIKCAEQEKEIKKLEMKARNLRDEKRLLQNEIEALKCQRNRVHTFLLQQLHR